MASVPRGAAKINQTDLPDGVVRDEPLSNRTTFRVGGPAEYFAEPSSRESLKRVLLWAHQNAIRVTVLGGGANVVVSDDGIDGLVVSTTALTSFATTGTTVTVGSGAPISAVAARTVSEGMTGLEFIYAMPGSVGGAVWMNARCYGSEIAEVLRTVEYLTLDGATQGCYRVDSGDFAYKRSPFQTGDKVIAAVQFELKRSDDVAAMQLRLEAVQRDRAAKGHFDLPCAGSVFKNNRAFGAPSGQILDTLGYRGRRHGGAQVNERHANIIVNTGTARADDIRELAIAMQHDVKQKYGFRLESEVLFVGRWKDAILP